LSTPSKPKILVVDDSETVLDITRLILEEHGFDVITLENPLAIPRAIRKERPDLVMVDVNMPSLSGDMVAKVVNGHGVSRNAVLVLYSDIPEAELALRAKQSGAAGYIVKTDDELKLVKQVRHWLSTRTAAATPLPPPVHER
jgi:two-component system, OmpR family, response regulator